MERPANFVVAKSEKLPKKSKALKAISKIHPEYYWVICIVCGEWCPQSNEGLFSTLDCVHLMCKDEKTYNAAAKKLLKERAKSRRISLF
jgi:hypothetical protein